MEIRRLLLGMGVALWMVACSSTSLTTSRDAGVEVQPAPDLSANTDLISFAPDSAALAPDTATPDVLGRDGAASDLADAVGTDLPARDLASADGAVPDVLVRDAVVDVLVRDAVVDVLVRDAVVDVLTREVRMADVATVEAAPDVRDSADPDAVGLADAREAAAHPFAGRTFRIDDTNPAPTPDPTCTSSGPASAANLTFSSDLTTLTGVASSGSTAFRFSATVGPEANKLTYHVTNLTGGQVFFERDQDVYVAQVALYGSGVPVMWCLRGALTPQP